MNFMKKFILFVVLYTSISSLAYSEDVLIKKIKKSMLKAEIAITRDAHQSMRRVNSKKIPIQTDLYTLSHYLMCSKYFKKNNKKLNQEIIQYFNQYPNEANIPWKIEGCLFPKVIVGLSKRGQRNTLIKMVSSQMAWTKNNFSEPFFRECFSNEIDRTYGKNEDFIPSGKNYTCMDSVENLSKYLYAFSKSRIKFYPWGSFDIRPSINQLNQFEPSSVKWPISWRDSIEECWIIYIKNMTSNELLIWPNKIKIVGDPLYQKVVRKMENIMTMFKEKKGEKQSIQRFNGHILAALILLGYGEDPVLKDYIEKLIRIQKRDGHWGNTYYPDQPYAANGGNTWTSPTFWSYWGLYCYTNQNQDKKILL